jgi:hypothetical protein
MDRLMGADFSVWLDSQEAEALIDLIDLNPDAIEIYGHNITRARRELVAKLGRDPRPHLADQ